MFTGIAIVAQLNDSRSALNNIRLKLRGDNFISRYRIREFLSVLDLNSGLKGFQFEIMLIHVPFFRIEHVNVVLKIRQRFPHAGLISLASEIDPSARFRVKDVPRHKLLNENLELDDLTKVIGKLLGADSSYPRQHSRVERIGDCELVNMVNGERTKCQFLDFAQMGARLILQTAVPLKKNTRFQLQYRSTSEPDRFHRILANIVWTEFSGGLVDSLVRGVKQTVGVRFIAAV